VLLPVISEDRDLKWITARHEVCQNKL